MQKRFCCTMLLSILCLGLAQAQLSQTSDDRMPRPLGSVLEQVGRQWGVKFKFEVDTTGLVLPYAESRIRPYSLDETLSNLLAPFDLKAWQQNNPKLYKIRAYEYARRYDADGARMLEWLQRQAPDSAAWCRRSQQLRAEARERLHLQPLLDRCVPLRPRLSKVRRYEGYSVQNIALETLPGLYVCGSIYAPLQKGRGVSSRKAQRHPVIICPNGHFADGRYRTDQQQRLGTLARMGAICIDFDSFGYGESILQTGEKEHAHAMAMVLQVLYGVRLLEYALTRQDVDANRLGTNGGSGGGTHAMLLSLVDDRFTAACPVVSVCSHFDGGCPCESGIPILRSAGGTVNIELAATFAPKPMMLVGDGGDWTHTYPTLEFPFVERIYDYYDARQNFQHRFFPDERHDFGPNKRKAVYDFFASVWQLDATCIDEDQVTIEPYDNLYSFGNDVKQLPAGALTRIEEIRRLVETYIDTENRNR